MEKLEFRSFFEFINERKYDNLDTTFVKTVLTKNKDKLFGQDLANLEIEEILNSIFAIHNISFTHSFGTSEFSSLSELGLINASIDLKGNIQIGYKDYFYETFEDDYLFNDLINVLERIVKHELVHFNQLRKIKQKSKDNYDFNNTLNKIQKDPSNRYKYLSSPQEMQAFAVEAVEEFRAVGYTDDEILNKIKKPFEAAPDSDTFYYYIDYFDYRGDWMSLKDKKEMQEILNKFLRYMYDYIKS